MDEAMTLSCPLAWTPDADAYEELSPNSVLLVHPGPAANFHYRTARSSPQGRTLSPDPWVIVSPRKLFILLDPTRRVELVDVGSLCCVLAFADLALGIRMQHDAPAPLTLESLPHGHCASLRAMQHWLVLQVMRGEDSALIDHLRRTESYRVVSYLLQEQTDPGHLKTRSHRYGVSYSYFRRLCSRALGGKVKPRLSQWRAARSALALIDGGASVLDIALANGYSCSSHISRDIRKSFGLTPTELRRAHDLLP